VGENELVVWRQNLLQQLLEKHIVFGDQQLHVLLLVSSSRFLPASQPVSRPPEARRLDLVCFGKRSWQEEKI
jgi:sugar-specific transcriptional regulator TrmB